MRRLKSALRALWEPQRDPFFVPPWSQRPEDYDALHQDFVWGQAIRAMGRRMEPAWEVYR